MKTKIVSGRLPLALAVVSVATTAAYGQANHLVISQVYGGGGGSSTTTTYTYNTDYIELYNPTNAAISLSGLSVQYGSSAGNFGASASNIKVLSGTVAAKGYYLVTGSSGTAGGPLPVTADATSSLALSATGGKVALINGTAGVSGTSCAGSSFVDEVTYGTGASCAETAATPALSNTTAAIRNSAGNDTDNNSADFTVGTPNPHNSTSGGGGTTALAIASAVANPASITAGSTTTLTVTVTPGSATTSVTVTADLSSIGGSATQALAAGGTANTYTYTASTSSSLAANNYTLPVKAVDQTSAVANGSIALTVTAPVTSTPISTIQANRSTYVGGTITTTGVITLVTSAGYYMQTPSSTPGSTGDEGIYVYSGSGKNPTGAVVGNNVTITGSLTLYPATNVSHTPSLEVTGATLTVNSTGNAVPPAIAINSISANGGIYQLTPYESMRVKFPSLTSTSGTAGYLTENTETTTSAGQFFATVTGTARPFREPGMDFRDFPTATCPTVTNCTATATVAGVARPSNLVLFDDNPERIIVESSLGGGSPVDVSSGAVLSQPTGVIDFTYSTDTPYGDPARILLEPGQFSNTSSNVTPGMTVKPVSVAGAGVFTVAAFNAERFFNTSASDNKYYNPVTSTVNTSSAVNITADAYARRLKKISLAIRTVINTPDIIAMEEVENKSVLQDIANQIDADGGTTNLYTPYGTDSVSTFTDDIGGISVGFLIKNTVTVSSWNQIGQNSTFTQAAGTTSTLNDRPSQVLKANISRGSDATAYPVTVIVNHLRSLSGINTSADTRTKKELQAEMLASAIQSGQANGEHVIAVGDFNAFQFSDGYTDTLGTVTGNVGNNIAAQPGKGGILSPNAVDLITTLPANLQQTYVEFGNAQVLDHVVITQELLNSMTMEVAHFDSDFPEVLGNDATTPARVSDHDVPVAYVTLPTPVSHGTLSGNGAFAPANVGTSAPGQQFTLTNDGERTITITGITTTGDFAQSNNCGSTLQVGANCLINVVFTPTAGGTRTGTLNVSGTGNVSPVTLTGTGVAGTPSVTATTSVSKSSAGYVVTVTMSNTGNGQATNVTLTGVTLGSASGAPVPQNVGSIAVNGSVSTTVTVPASAGASGATVAEKVTGTYTGGSFSGTYRVKLPN